MVGGESWSERPLQVRGTPDPPVRNKGLFADHRKLLESLLFGLHFPFGLLVTTLGLPFLPAPLLERLVRAVTVSCPQKRAEHVQGDGEDDGGVVLGGDLVQRLKKPKLQCGRALQSVRRLPEPLRRLVLPLSSYYLRPPLPLALGLPRHRPLHLLRDLHVLHLDDANLHPPGVGLLVYYGLELLVYGLPVGEEVVEVLLSEDAP